MLSTTCSRRVKWAEIVKQIGHIRGSGGTEGQNPTVGKPARPRSSTSARVMEQTHPVAAYVRSIRKEPVGAIRNSLQQSLPSWALFGLSSIGGSVVEIITDDWQKLQVVVDLKVIGAREIKGFEVFELVIRKEHNDEAEKQRKIKTIDTTI